nr:MAG TPA: hypothetical protein [Caudoviricetes sp.]
MTKLSFFSSVSGRFPCPPFFAHRKTPISCFILHTFGRVII